MLARLQEIFTANELGAAACEDRLPLRCVRCQTIFHWPKNWILTARREAGRGKTGRGSRSGKFCSQQCGRLAHRKAVAVACEWCEAWFTKQAKEIRRSKHHFCGRSCAARWRNAHKTHGVRRSKLERWLEERLRKGFPRTDFRFNSRPFGHELDIYVPALRIAYEINGVAHYRPIWGESKLASVQANDDLRRVSCAARGVGLIEIDVSQMQHFTPKNGLPILQRITDDLNERARKESNLQPRD
jgi:hypothetical protein